MKKILILGAANDQLLLISKSKELGYYVIVCDRTTTNPGLKYVDKHYQVDYMDREVVLQIAKVEEVDGIISNSEVVMQNVAYVCEELGLRGNTLESIRNIGEKNLFRKLQNRIGVFAPKQTDVDTMENAIQAIKEMSLPVLIKPCRNSASRGITKIDSFDESLIRKSFENSARDSWNKKVTVEEFVEMPSLTVIEGDIFIYDGKILWDGIFNDQRSSGAPMVPMSDISPLHLSSEKKNVIKDTVAKIVKGAGLEFGQFNIEMYFTKDTQLFVIESNTRQGGIGVPKFIEQYSGLDYTKLLVSLCVNDYSYCNVLDECRYPMFKYLTRHSVFSRDEGIYDGLYIAEEIKDFVCGIEENFNKGEKVLICEDGTDAVARIDFEFHTLEEQNKYAYSIENYIYPKLK